jgi:hypothetical protein
MPLLNLRYLNYLKILQDLRMGGSPYFFETHPVVSLQYWWVLIL